MLRVLIAEDSPVVQRTLKTLLEGETGIDVIGVASTGTEAVEMCRQLRPDLVTMDIFMPEMDGLEATRKIMELCPTRIVIVSSMAGTRDVDTTFEAMRSGAVEVIEKPHGVLAGKYAEVKQRLVRVLTEIGEARPSRAPRTPARMASVPPGPPRSSVLPVSPTAVTKAERTARRSRVPKQFSASVICLGGSTGAPAILAEILAILPQDYPIPIVIAQHIARGFGAGMASWLDHIVPMEVKVAEDNDPLLPGLVLVGPDNKHMTFGAARRVHLSSPKGPEDHTPSINSFFKSASERFGDRGVGIIFSGMGSDGAQGLLQMRNAGSVTLVQNEDTSVVYGMPKVAMEIGAGMESLSPSEIAHFLLEIGEV